MITQKKLDLLIHEFNDGGIRSVGGLTNFDRMVLMRHFAKYAPKCPCDKPHTN